MENSPEVKIQISVPVMHKVRFSELSGVDVGVVDGWIKKGLIPTKKVGRCRMINIAVFHEECLEDE